MQVGLSQSDGQPVFFLEQPQGTIPSDATPDRSHGWALLDEIRGEGDIRRLGGLSCRSSD